MRIFSTKLVEQPRFLYCLKFYFRTAQIQSVTVTIFIVLNSDEMLLCKLDEHVITTTNYSMVQPKNLYDCGK